MTSRDRDLESLLSQVISFVLSQWNRIARLDLTCGNSRLRPVYVCSRRLLPIVVAVATLTTVGWCQVAAGQNEPPEKPAAKDPPSSGTDTPQPQEAPGADSAKDPTARPATKDPAGMKRLMPKYDLWIDPKRKWVVVQGRVCLRRGALEMFACPEGTKEHESIVALNCKAWHVHAALIAVGAKPIHPVRFDPEYVPAKGTEIDIDVLWKDSQGEKRQASARDWIVDGNDKPLKYPWVFGGSRFFKDEMTGKEIYLAEDGDLICVSNFTTATLDLPIESTADAGSQLFYAKTDAIPQIDTVVRLVLKPRLDKKDEPKKPKAGDAKAGDAKAGDAKAGEASGSASEATAK